MREYLNSTVKTNQCAQCVNYIETRTKNATDCTRVVIQCVRKAELVMTVEKCHIVIRQVEFLGKTNSPKRVSKQTQQTEKFLSQMKLTVSKKGLPPVSRTLTQNFYSQDGWTVFPIQNIAQKRPSKIQPITWNLWISAENSIWCLFTSFKQPLPRRKLILKMKSKFRGAVYEHLIEDKQK